MPVDKPVPGIRRDAEEPIFREPWEARVFAMTLALHDRGLFAWAEWEAALAEEIGKAQAAGDSDTGQTSKRHWLAALERTVTQKSVATAQALAQHRDAWHRAADRTPHGTTIALRADDFSSRAPQVVRPSLPAD